MAMNTDSILRIVRDPVWQFIGVVLAALGLAVPLIWRSLRSPAKQEQSWTPAPIVSHSRHKRRRADGVLVANISSDFLNQFPVRVGDLAAHVDCLYTPENFGASDWLAVFQRLVQEGYLTPVKPVRRLGLDTLVSHGPQIQSHLEITRRNRREIEGLD